ncbi:dickkopf-related protein 3a isoform X2 [Pygocentrus nattereri]|uniref:dickkopf-related protein 3a isoform X2 n=1 Tax=Pygocentrus nattereri TaxID=42514 RepID=UPI0008146843|nr:dickkopf-related protein 3a isoform X2 [Pygocentrus nattereri]
MHVLELSVCLAVTSAIAAANAVHADLNGTVEADGARGQTTLGDMFREVEELMEDTQHKLEDAVHQMDNESAKSSQHVQNFASHFNNESSSEIVLGNQSTPAVGKIDKILENRTEETHISRTIIQTNGKENDTNHECVIDEDCEKGSYCLYEVNHSKCLACKETCTKDEECCEGQLCVWGQCTKNTTKGEAGTICAYQSDCSSGLCCAFHKALLFPVCISKPTERERCLISASHLMDLLSWDLEGEGPREHCPCTGDLQCQHLGRGSLCLKGQSSSEEDLTDTLYSEIDYIV